MAAGEDAAHGVTPGGIDKQAIIQACKDGKSNKALELAGKLTSAHPDQADLADVLFQAGAMLAQAKQFDPAAGFYQLLIEKFPGSRHLEDAHTELAACYYQARKLAESQKQVLANMKLYPKSQWVEYWKFLDAQIHYRRYEFAEAKAGYEAFLKEYPDSQYSAHCHADLGRIDPPWEIDRHGIVSYSGKFEQDIRFRAALKVAPKHIENGYGILERLLGTDLRTHTNVILLFKDSGIHSKAGLQATTRIVGINNQPKTMVEFYTDSIVTNPEGFRKTIVHEMKHAGFIGLMGQSYHDLPEWIREGLAVWGSDDIDTRVSLVLSNAIISGGDPLEILDGIEDPDHDETDYLEDGLAFEWLESRKAGNVKAFCTRLVKGEPYQKIWSDLAGTGDEESMALANDHCRRRVKEALGMAHESFVPLRKGAEAAVTKGGEAAKAWLADGGEADLNMWLETNAGHPAAPFGRFWLGRALIEAGWHDPGRALLQQIIDQDAERCTLLDDAQFFIGYSYNLQRDAKVREAFGVLIRDYPRSMHTKQFIGKLPPAAPVTR